VVLTVLTDNCKKIFEKYDLKREKTDTYIDVLIPISFNFHAVVIKPQTHKIPLAYPIAGGDKVLADIINKWIYLVKDGPSYKRKYDYWIMGIGAEKKKPRWSVLRDVLGWGLDEEDKGQEKPAANSNKPKPK